MTFSTHSRLKINQFWMLPAKALISDQHTLLSIIKLTVPIFTLSRKIISDYLWPSAFFNWNRIFTLTLQVEMDWFRSLCVWCERKNWKIPFWGNGKKSARRFFVAFFAVLAQTCELILLQIDADFNTKKLCTCFTESPRNVSIFHQMQKQKSFEMQSDCP